MRAWLTALTSTLTLRVVALCGAAGAVVLAYGVLESFGDDQVIDRGGGTGFVLVPIVGTTFFLGVALYADRLRSTPAGRGWSAAIAITATMFGLLREV